MKIPFYSLMTGIALIAISCSPKTTTSTSAQSSGKDLFMLKCSVCHITTRPSKEQAKYMLAPPIMGVMNHVKEGIQAESASEKRKKSIAFIVDYVHHPAKDKSLCEPHAIERFGLMPSLKASVTEEELRLIANYLYDHFPPKDMDHDKLSKDMGH